MKTGTARPETETTITTSDPMDMLGNKSWREQIEFLLDVGGCDSGDRFEALQVVSGYEAQLNSVYKERNVLVALLAREFPAGTARPEIQGWDPAWLNAVYVDHPAGQCSWHYHDRDKPLFASLPPYEGEWDGHTTDEKYAKLRAHIGAWDRMMAAFSPAEINSLLEGASRREADVERISKLEAEVKRLTSENRVYERTMQMIAAIEPALPVDEDWISRLREEHHELVSKLGKLDNFLSSNPSDRPMMSYVDLGLLKTQLQAMRTYAHILEMRIWRADMQQHDGEEVAVRGIGPTAIRTTFDRNGKAIAAPKTGEAA